MTGEVQAVTAWPTNAELIADVARLGHLGDRPTWDGTHGLGVWWRQWRPTVLHRTDLRPDKSPDAPDGLDATATGWPDGRWEQVALDPPYGLRGTDTGDAQLDRFGLAESMTRDARHDLMARMLIEGARLLAPGGTLLFRCQDQIEGSRLRLQSHAFAALGEALGLEVVDLLGMLGGRPQPAGRAQHHARRNVSQLIVFRRPRRPRVPALRLTQLAPAALTDVHRLTEVAS